MVVEEGLRTVNERLLDLREEQEQVQLDLDQLDPDQQKEQEANLKRLEVQVRELKDLPLTHQQQELSNRNQPQQQEKINSKKISLCNIMKLIQTPSQQDQDIQKEIEKELQLNQENELEKTKKRERSQQQILSKHPKNLPEKLNPKHPLTNQQQDRDIQREIVQDLQTNQGSQINQPEEDFRVKQPQKQQEKTLYMKKSLTLALGVVLEKGKEAEEIAKAPQKADLKEQEQERPEQQQQEDALDKETGWFHNRVVDINSNTYGLPNMFEMYWICTDCIRILLRNFMIFFVQNLKKKKRHPELIILIL